MVEDVARYEEACRTPGTGIHIVISRDVVERALLRLDGDMSNEEKNVMVNNSMTFEGDLSLIPGFYIRREIHNS